MSGYSFFGVICLSLMAPSALLAAPSMEQLCGKAPRGLVISSEASREIRAIAERGLTETGVQSSVEEANREIFQRFDDPDTVIINSYLAFVYCTTIQSSNDLTGIQKANLILDYRLAVNGTSERQVKSDTDRDAQFSLAGFRGSIFGFGVSEDIFNSGKEHMEDLGLNFEGYNSFVWPSRLEWSADRNTVFYYVDENKQKAQELANYLKRRMSRSFVIAKGAGYGVFDGQERYTLFIHLVR